RIRKRGTEEFEELDEKQLKELSKDELLCRYDNPISILGSGDRAHKLVAILEEKLGQQSKIIRSSDVASAHQKIIVDETLQRAFAKIAFNYLVFACEEKCPKEPYFEYFDAARKFVRYGTEPGGYAVLSPWKFEKLPDVSNIFRNVGHLVML